MTSFSPPWISHHSRLSSYRRVRTRATGFLLEQILGLATQLLHENRHLAPTAASLARL